MICESCRKAADLSTPLKRADYAIKQILHEDCKGGTWCDCQHRVKFPEDHHEQTR